MRVGRGPRTLVMLALGLAGCAGYHPIHPVQPTTSKGARRARGCYDASSLGKQNKTFHYHVGMRMKGPGRPAVVKLLVAEPADPALAECILHGYQTLEFHEQATGLCMEISQTFPRGRDTGEHHRGSWCKKRSGDAN